MAAETFVVEITSSRHLETQDLERALLRLHGVSEVHASNPEAEDQQALLEMDPAQPRTPHAYEEEEG